MARNYKELKVWQKAVELAVATYAATEDFPKAELYGLANQMRRAAVSIASNIAKGSLAEFETQSIIARKLNFLNQEQHMKLLNESIEIGKMLNGLCNKLATSPLETGDRRLETTHA